MTTGLLNPTHIILLLLVALIILGPKRLPQAGRSGTGVVGMTGCCAVAVAGAAGCGACATAAGAAVGVYTCVCSTVSSWPLMPSLNSRIPRPIRATSSDGRS